MSFQVDKNRLESKFEVLKQQSASTFENWEDPVQRRFYEQFINTLPKEFKTYIDELSKLDKTFERAENIIDNLR